MQDKNRSTGRASVDRAMALRDVMAHAVDAEKEFRKSSVPKASSGRGAMLTLSFGLIAFTLFAYMAKPEFIFGANPNNVPEVRRDANVRFTIFLLSRKLETYKNASKQYPADLSPIAGAPANVKYARLSETTFELRASDGSKEIVFRSDEPLDRFLGQSPKILSGRGQGQ
jgi:hypothetical protein